MEEQNNTEEFTFVSLGRTLKKSFLRIVVYVVISVMVATAICIIINQTTVDRSFSTTIAFSNEGAENGLDTLGNPENITLKITSAYNVNKALKTCGYSDEEIVAMEEDVIKNVSVSPIIPEGVKVEDTEYFPSKYRIILTKTSDLKIAAVDYNKILNALVTEYIKSFNASSAYKVQIDAPVINVVGNNYIKTAETLMSNYIEGKIVAADLAVRASNFYSENDKTTFAAIAARYDGVKVEIDSLLSFVVNKGLSVTTAGESESEYLAMKVSEKESDVTNLDARSKSLNALVEAASGKLPPNITGGTGNTNVIIDETKYYELVAQAAAASSDLASAQSELAVWKNYQATYNAAIEASGSIAADELASRNADAVTRINEIQTALANLASKMTALADEYNEIMAQTQSVKQINAVSVYNYSLLSGTLIIIVDAVVFIVAALAAVLVTKRKNAKLSFNLRRSAKSADANEKELSDKDENPPTEE